MVEICHVFSLLMINKKKSVFPFVIRCCNLWKKNFSIVQKFFFVYHDQIDVSWRCEYIDYLAINMEIPVLCKIESFKHRTRFALLIFFLFCFVLITIIFSFFSLYDPTSISYTNTL